MGEIRCLNETGDTKLAWDPEKSEETDAAKEMFKSLKKKGYQAYSVKKGGEKNKPIDDFDPDAGLIIMVPKIVGG